MFKAANYGRDEKKALPVVDRPSLHGVERGLGAAGYERISSFVFSRSPLPLPAVGLFPCIVILARIDD